MVVRKSTGDTRRVGAMEMVELTVDVLQNMRERTPIKGQKHQGGASKFMKLHELHEATSRPRNISGFIDHSHFTTFFRQWAQSLNELTDLK